MNAVKLSKAQRNRVVEFVVFCQANGYNPSESLTMLQYQEAQRMIKKGLLVEVGKDEKGQRLYRYTELCFELYYGRAGKYNHAGYWGHK